MLDGACDVEKLCYRAKELGMPAVAMTDHGNIFGAVHFVNAAKAADIKPIIGCELYVCKKDDHRIARTPPDGDTYNHLLVLAEQARPGGSDPFLELRRPANREPVKEARNIEGGGARGILLQRGCRSAAEGLNRGLEQARHAVVVCLHQDVYLPEGWDRRFWRQYRGAERSLGRDILEFQFFNG